ncbi:MAG: hypothetical protein AABX23_03200 [Nanoarchaeota archaeon]
MEINTIKGISTEKWVKLKVLAAKNKVAMGKLVENMIDNYEKQNDDFWNEILSGEKRISEEEAEIMQKIANKSRKEWGFRK